MNNGTFIVNLGNNPTEMTFGETKVYKLRCAEKAGNKKAVTRWFNAYVRGGDTAVAARLSEGDSIALTGELSLTEYAPKTPKYKGEMVREDEIPFARILRVIKSKTFFDAPATDAGDAPPDLAGL